MEKFPGRNSDKIESKAEKLLSREEVLEALSRYAEIETVSIVKEKSDERGVWLLEIETSGRAPGETAVYCYIRKGLKVEENTMNDSEETKINVVYFEDDIPIHGHSVARFNEETGEWE